MRWQNLFDDLEGQLEQELAVEEHDLLAEEERLRIARLSLRDRIAALVPHGAPPLALVLRDGVSVSLTVLAVGRDWLAGEEPGGRSSRSAIIPLDSIRRIPLAPERLHEGLQARSGSDPPAALSARLGLAFVLRDLARRRSGVAIDTGDGRLTGTIDRVGRDHFDLAEHPAGESRRSGAVSRISLVPFAALSAVRF